MRAAWYIGRPARYSYDWRLPSREFDTAKHPHKPAGKGGGQFAPKGYVGEGQVATDVLGDSVDITSSPHKSGTELIAKHLRDLDKLPVQVATALQDEGTKWYIGGDVSITGLDHNQFLQGVRPRGWSEGSTWDSVGGCYGDGEVCAGASRGGSVAVVLHETGHAIGDKLGWDDSPELRDHHVRLFDRLGPYFRQGGPGGTAGRQELLAEGVAQVLTSRTDAVKAYDEAYVSWLEAGPLSGASA